MYLYYIPVFRLAKLKTSHVLATVAELALAILADATLIEMYVLSRLIITVAFTRKFCVKRALFYLQWQFIEQFSNCTEPSPSVGLPCPILIKLGSIP
jgi:hypothetical protein